MKRTALVLLFLLLYPVWPVLGQQPGRMKLTIQGGEPRQPTMDKKEQPAQALTNDSIVKLVKAGFSNETIISMVEHQPGNYSLAVDDITALKRAGVSEKVITAMVSKPASQMPTPPASPSAPPDKQAEAPKPTVTAPTTRDPIPDRDRFGGERPLLGSQEPRIPNEAGLFALGPGGRLDRIEGRATSFVRSGSLLASAATLGIHANRVNTQIPGSRASVTVSPNPAFYYRPVQDEGGLDLILTRLTVKSGRRQFEVGAQGAWRSSKGVSVRHQLDFDAKQVEPRLYKIVLTHELESGQYAFYLLRGREHASVSEGSGFVNCFQVE